MLTVTSYKNNNMGRLGKGKKKEIQNRINVFNSIQNDSYLQFNVYLSLGKSATVRFKQIYDRNALANMMKFLMLCS